MLLELPRIMLRARISAAQLDQLPEIRHRLLRHQRTASVAQKPVCLHENGPIPDPEKMKADGAKWLWFMTWHTSFIDSDPINTASYLRQVYNSDYMLTLDELPDAVGV